MRTVAVALEPREGAKGVRMNPYAKRFSIVLWIGIVANGVLSVPVIFFPQALLNILGFRPTADPVWTAFSGLLIVLLSLFYIPAALRPYRYRINAWLAVYARAQGVIFFFVLYPGYYPAFGLLDGVFLLIELPLLILAMRERPSASMTDEAPEAMTPQIAVDNRAALWLKRTIWLGIVVNLVLSVPTVFTPENMMILLGQRPTLDPLWTAFAASILILLSLFYMPGANQPYRYRADVWLALLCRLAGVIFFLFIWPAFYPLFGVLDGVMFLIQIPFFILTVRRSAARRLL
jgi:hypothetical protein